MAINENLGVVGHGKTKESAIKSAKIQAVDYFLENFSKIKTL
jgi:hypothetical protein